MVDEFETLISSDGQFNADALRTLPTPTEDEHVTLITAFSAYGLEQGNLLNDIFQTSFPTTNNILTTSLANVPGHDSAIMAENPRHLTILNPQSFDSPNINEQSGTDSEEICEMSWNVCLSLSNVILFVVRMNDLARPLSNGLDGLRASLTQLLLFNADGIIPLLRRKAFVVVVKDYEPDVISRDEIVSGFLTQMQTMYGMVTKTPRSPSRISDLFEFEFALIPSAVISDGSEYNGSIKKLQDKLVEPTSDDYLFENGAYALHSNDGNVNSTDSSASDYPSPAEIGEGAWKKMEKDRTQDVPPKQDLMSAFDCDNAMRKVYEKYERSVRVWKREIKGGVIIEHFGNHASQIYKDTISVYDQDALPYKKTKAFERKNEELKDLLDTDLYSLFVTQLAKLREVTYRKFKDELNEIHEEQEHDGKLDKAVKTLLRNTEKEFRNQAADLKPKFTNWRFDNDVTELAVKMREDSTDMLQRARIAEYQDGGGGGRRNRRRAAAIAASAQPKRRQPISLGIHYLDPAPFGFKDSRFEKLGEEDAMHFQGDGALGGSGRGAIGVLAPGKDSGWNRANQDFVFTDRK